MPPKRTRSASRCAALALTLVAVHAQDKPNGFYLTSPLSLSSGYDQGFIVGSSALNDSVSFLAAPTFAWIRSTHRTDFFVDYQPEFELFARNPNLDAWNHSTHLRYRYQINSRWSIDGGDVFLSTMDATRALANSLLLLPLGRFTQNVAYAGMSYHANGLTKVSFRIDNALTSSDLPGTLSGRLDGVTTAGTVTVDRILTSRHKLSGSYSFLHSDPFNPQISGSATNVNLFNLGYTFDVNPGMIVRLAGGAVEGKGTSSFIGAAAVEKRLGGMWLAGGYQRYMSFFGGLSPVGGVPLAGLTPNSVYQVASARAWGQLTHRLGMEGSVQRALNETDPRFGSVRSLIDGLRFRYKLTDRVSAFVLAEHYGQNANPFLDIPMSRNRFFGGLEIWTLRPAERQTAPNRHRTAPQDSDQLKAANPAEEK